MTARRRRASITAAMWKVLYAAIGSECPLCLWPLTHGQEFNVDHIVPVSAGGSDGIDNLRLVHGWCNRARYNKRDYFSRFPNVLSANYASRRVARATETVTPATSAVTPATVSE